MTAVIANGIPKSGTYLLDSILRCTGMWNNLKIHITNFGGVDYSCDESREKELGFSGSPLQIIDEMTDGNYLNAHLTFDQEIERMIMINKPLRNLRHVLFIRDPRDAIVSQMLWQTYNPVFARNETNFVKQKFLRELKNDTERIMYILGDWESFGFGDYVGWLQSPACHVVRFEEIYAEMTIQETDLTMTRLLDYLSIPHEMASSICEKSLEVGFTSSGDQNKIGRYKKYFNAEVRRLMDPKLLQAISSLGYQDL